MTVDEPCGSPADRREHPPLITLDQTCTGTWYSAGNVTAYGHTGSVELDNNSHDSWHSFGAAGINLYNIFRDQAAAVAIKITS